MSESPLTVSLDQGGHSSRAIVFDSQGQFIAEARREVAEERPAEDRVEQDPERLVLSLRESLDEVCAALGEDARRITKIGLATQRSSLVCWNSRTGHALSPVLSWQDRRAADWLAEFASHADRVREITGLFLSPHYGVSKMAWCLRELPEVQAALRAGELRIGPLASFLALRLMNSEDAPIDPCNAGRTLLFDFREQDWSAELLELFEIPREILPVCKPTSFEFGMISTPVGERPLEILSGDQPAALFAHGAPDDDTIHVNLGTGAFVLRTLTRIDEAPKRLLVSVARSDENRVQHVVEGTVNGAASALDYAARELGLDEWESQLDNWLRKDSEPLLFLNGVAGIGSPYWVPNLQSRWVALGDSGAVRDAGAMMTAVAESILFLVKRNLHELMTLAPRPTRIRVTGGLSNSGALCQRLANLSGLLVERPIVREATARGTAFWLAGEPDDWPALGSPTEFEPRNDSELVDRYRRWLEALRLAIG